MTKKEYDQIQDAFRIQIIIADLAEKTGGEDGKFYADAVRTTVNCLKKDIDEIYFGDKKGDA